MVASPRLSTNRPCFTAAGAGACAAVALWVSFGALSFVDADNGAAHVGVLPPLLRLFLLLIAVAVLTIAVRPSAAATAPLWLSAVALLPWLPLPMPLSVFIWTGNLLWWLWAAIAVALLAPAAGRLLRSGGLIDMSPRRAAIAAGLLAAAVYGLGAWSVAPVHPNGDEPHYLIIVQSLLKDHDLRIENNHRDHDYKSYLSRSIKPDFVQRGRDGEIRSIHAPGLPVLVAPAFALLGYRGVLVELVIVAAAASALVWLIAFRVTGDAPASWFGWAAVALTAPYALHAAAVFPDGPGAALMLFALLPLLDARAREPGRLMAIGAALAVLPWLHSRFAILAASAGLVIAGRVLPERSRRTQRIVAFATCPILSAAAWFLFFQMVYGTPNPSIAYGGASNTAVANIVHGAAGLLADQQFGLVPNAPVYLCALAGVVLMFSGARRRLAAELLVIAVPYFLLVSSFNMWWGGTTAPARFLVPVMLMFAVPSAVWFAAAKSAIGRTASLTALLVSLLITITVVSVGRGALVFNVRDGVSRLAGWLSPVVDLGKGLPSLFQSPAPIVAQQAAVWLAAIGSALAVGTLFNRRGRAAVILGFGLTLEAAAMAAVSWVWRSNQATVATPYAAGPAVLRRSSVDDDHADQIAVAYRPFQRLERVDLPRRIVLTRILSTVPRAASASIAHLPAGVYEMKGRVVGAATGNLWLKTHREAAPLADWDAVSLEASWTRRVTIPVAVAGLQIEADAAARAAIRDVSIRAVSLSTPEQRLDNREAMRGARYGRFLVFLLGGAAWVESGGTWIAGGSNAEFVIASEPQLPFQLLVRNGPVDNDVTLESAAWPERLLLKPGEERLVQVPTEGGRRATPLRVTATTGFRPADLDATSEDLRFLGVWIEPR